MYYYYRKNKELEGKFLLTLIAIAVFYKYPILVGVLVLGIIIYFIKKSNQEPVSVASPQIQQVPYKKKQFLMTKAEYNFDRVLREVVQDKYEIERQVVLSRLVEPTSENLTDYKTGRKFNPDRSKIDKKTVDFVLFNKAGYTPYLAIELDDSSHLKEERKERDSFVEDVLSGVGIRLVRIKTSYNYNLSEIAGLIIEPTQSRK